MRQYLLGWILITWLLLAGCSSAASQPAATDGELVVFAAASLTEAFTDLAGRFEQQHPGVAVILNLAGSQQLAHQLGQGAPADVFASADQEQMEAVIATGRVKASQRQSFAANRLALILPATNRAGLRTLSDLARPGVRLVLAAPEVPAGRYAMRFLDAAAADPAFGPVFRDRVLANVVSYEENVRAVLSKVRLDEADAAIVYASDAKPEFAAEILQLTIPEQLNVRADYWIAPLDAANSALADEFVDFILSNQGQELLRSHGLIPVAGQ